MHTPPYLTSAVYVVEWKWEFNHKEADTNEGQQHKCEYKGLK